MVLEPVSNLLRRAGGVAAAWLPRRTWPSLDRYLPVTSSAVLSGLLTLFAGFAIGFPGFMDHAGGTSRAYIDLLVDAADRGRYVTRDLAVGMNVVALFTFVFLTPTGWIAFYLVLSGFFRSATAWFDDGRGDPILSVADATVRALARRRRALRTARDREQLEGPPTRDIVVTGDRAGVVGAELVVVASRRKPGWEAGTVVITTGATYRIGTVIERTIEGRLRTLYPLTEHRDYEAFRRTVRYEMPQSVARS